MSNPYEHPHSGNAVANWIRRTYSADMIEIDEFRQKEVVLKLPHDLSDVNLLFEDIEDEFGDKNISFRFFMACGQPRVALGISSKDTIPQTPHISSNFWILLVVVLCSAILAMCGTLIYTKYIRAS